MLLHFAWGEPRATAQGCGQNDSFCGPDGCPAGSAKRLTGRRPTDSSARGAGQDRRGPAFTFIRILDSPLTNSFWTGMSGAARRKAADGDDVAIEDENECGRREWPEESHVPHRESRDTGKKRRGRGPSDGQPNWVQPDSRCSRSSSAKRSISSECPVTWKM